MTAKEGTAMPSRAATALPLLATLVVGAASFALSFVALRDVAASTNAVAAHLAALVPAVIDGGVICGSATIWLQSREGRRTVFPFLFVAFLLVVSVVVNVAHAGPTMLAKGIAALPPLVLLGSLELVAGQLLRRRTAPVAQVEQPAHTAPGAAPQSAHTVAKGSTATSRTAANPGLVKRIAEAVAAAPPEQRRQRLIAEQVGTNKSALVRAVQTTGMSWDEFVHNHTTDKEEAAA